MKKAYDKIEWCEAQNTGAVACSKCMRLFEKHPGERILICTTEVSYMRGDDELEFFCIPCGTGMGFTLPPSRAERHEQSLKDQLRNLERSLASGKCASRERTKKNRDRVAKELAAIQIRNHTARAIDMTRP